MIQLTRLNRLPLVLNSDLIEYIEITPDTVIAMTSGLKFMVLESADEVIEKVVDFRRTILNRPEKGSACEEPTLAVEEQR